jgi:hypothetical protein
MAMLRLLHSADIKAGEYLDDSARFGAFLPCLGDFEMLNIDYMTASSLVIQVDLLCYLVINCPLWISKLLSRPSRLNISSNSDAAIHALVEPAILQEERIPLGGQG